jgi:hypothetical protein
MVSGNTKLKYKMTQKYAQVNQDKTETEIINSFLFIKMIKRPENHDNSR